MQNNEKSRFSEYYHQVKVESLLFSNIMLIFEKLNFENQLDDLTSSIQSIFEHEINFAKFELLKIIHTTPNFNLNDQLVQNTLTFKENFKLICASLSLLKSRFNLDKTNTKGKFSKLSTSEIYLYKPKKVFRCNQRNNR